MNDQTIQQRLEELRALLRAGCMSWGELHELYSLGDCGHIAADDVELREAAGLPEFPDDEAESMTIAALIAALQTHDPDKRVVVLDAQNNPCDIAGTDSYQDAIVLVTEATA